MSLLFIVNSVQRRCSLLLQTRYRGLLVCLSVTVANPAKTAELIEMLFALWARIGPRNHLLDGGPDTPWEAAILRGGGRAAHCKVKGCFAMSFAKTAEPFEMLFGIWTLTVPRNHVLHGV